MVLDLFLQSVDILGLLRPQAIPKHDGDWQTICYLSALHGPSINNHIDPNLFTLTYCSMDDAYAIVKTN